MPSRETCWVIVSSGGAPCEIAESSIFAAQYLNQCQPKSFTYTYARSGMRLRLKIYTAHCKFFYTSFCIGEFGSESNCCFAIGVPRISTAQCSAPLGGEHMEPAFITYARQLCKAVAEEANQDRVK